MKGRKPKPTALKILTGNPGHRAKDDLGRGEPDPEVMLGEPPERLNEVGRQYWYSEGAVLLKTRVITAADQDAFADLCYFHQRKAAVVASIARIEAKKKRSGKEELALAMLQSQLFKLSDRMHKARLEFGMTPASRSRVKISDGQSELNFGAPESPLAKATSMARSA